MVSAQIMGPWLDCRRMRLVPMAAAGNEIFGSLKSSQWSATMAVAASAGVNRMENAVSVMLSVMGLQC